MANLYGKNATNYRKYITPAYDAGMDSMTSNRQLKFELPGSKNVLASIKNTPQNKKNLNLFREMALQTWTKSPTRDGPRDIQVETTQGTFEFSRISASECRPKGHAQFNKGNVAEGILAAAIAARFISKTRDVRKQDVVNVINKVKARKTSNKAESTFKSPNANPDIVDEVRCLIRLAEHELAAALDIKLLDDVLSDILSSAIDFVNKPLVQQWADLLYKNNRVDKIEVISDGVSDQSGTKVDLFVLINGKKENVNISLKAGPVKQFGQMSGATFEIMEQMFNPLGIRFDNTVKNKFNSFLKDASLVMHEKSVAAIDYIYTLAQKKMDTQITQDYNKFLKNLSNFVKYHATLNEPDVFLVQLDRSESKIYDFDQLSKALDKLDTKLTTTMVYQNITGEAASYFQGGAPQLPKIVIHIDGMAPTQGGILEIRSKIDNRGSMQPFYHRNYFNKGSYLTKLIAS